MEATPFLLLKSHFSDIFLRFSLARVAQLAGVSLDKGPKRKTGARRREEGSRAKSVDFDL